jgi:hypothetical protein
MKWNISHLSSKLGKKLLYNATPLRYNKSKYLEKYVFCKLPFPLDYSILFGIGNEKIKQDFEM